MDMDNAAVFLAGTILYALGLLIILSATIIANNLLHKFWKSFGWTFLPTWMHQEPTRFMTPEEEARVAPHLEDPVSGQPHKTK